MRKTAFKFNFGWHYWLAMFMLVAVATSEISCAGGPKNRNGKKVKRGKPMPCPIKDC